MKAYYAAKNVYKSSSHPTFEASTYKPVYNTLFL